MSVLLWLVQWIFERATNIKTLKHRNNLTGLGPSTKYSLILAKRPRSDMKSFIEQYIVKFTSITVKIVQISGLGQISGVFRLSSF